MSRAAPRRTPEQQLNLEKKFGLGLLAGLFALFCFVLSFRVGGFSWNQERVIVSFGGETEAAAVGLTPSTDPIAPPKVFLPPAPEAGVAQNVAPPPWPTNLKPAAAPAQTAPAATDFAAKPPPLPPVGTPKTATQPTPMAPQVLSVPPTVAAVTAPPRAPGVAAIGLVAETAATPHKTASPASAAVPIAATPAGTHVFVDGDTFWSVAAQAYGDGTYYRALFAYNRDRYPHMEDVRIGDRIDVPAIADLRGKFPQLCPDAAIAANGVNAATSAASETNSNYTVQAGDTLFEIARRRLGNAARWQEIYQLNRATLGENLEELRPGTTLRLPTP